MKNNKTLGIVLYGTELHRTYQTLFHILSNTRNWRQRIQVTLILQNPLEKELEEHQRELHAKKEKMVPLGIENMINLEEIKEEELLELAQSHGVKVYADYEGIHEENILKTVLETMDVTYLYILAGGMFLSETDWLELWDILEKEEIDKLLLSVNVKNPSTAVKEHNAFIRRIQEGISLNEVDSYHLSHTCFYACFVKKSLLPIHELPDEKNGLHWSMMIRRLYFNILSDLIDVPVSTVKVKLFERKQEFYSWSQLREEAGFEAFMNEFLRPVFLSCREKGKACSKNAKYNLLFYVKKILTDHPLEKEEFLAEEVDEIISFMESPELILINQYFNRVHKNYLLNHFKWNPLKTQDLQVRARNVNNEKLLENTIYFWKIQDGKIIFDGSTSIMGEEDFLVYLLVNGEPVLCDTFRDENYREWFGRKISRSNYFHAEVPITDSKQYRFEILCRRGRRVVKKIVWDFGKYMPFVNNIPYFIKKDGWLFYYNQRKHCLILEPDQKRKSLWMAIKRDFTLLRGEKAAKKAFLARAIYTIEKKRQKKSTWLISDRANRADDNGECFYTYLSNHPLQDVEPCFVIDKNCPEYSRLGQMGKVISTFSWSHKMQHLLCQYVVSSHANKPVINPFGKYEKYYRDILYDKKFVFLQHGVTKDDQSAWLNRFNRNLYGFVVSTRAEYDSVLEGDYFYDERQVWLTGMPRFDRLYRNEQKYITVMPTWRKTLSSGTNSAGEWQVCEEFAESPYFLFYNKLLNHKKLLKAAGDRGYTVCFMPHPNIMPAINLFHKNKEVQFWDAGKSYRDVFAETDLMITDYSSVAFDFAYLRKPIIYSQFDREEFFAGGHSYTEGYYDYETDGFGEIVPDLEELVDKIIDYMDHNCRLKEEYRERIDNTFAFSDDNCCERVLKEMLRIREKTCDRS